MYYAGTLSEAKEKARKYVQMPVVKRTGFKPVIEEYDFDGTLLARHTYVHTKKFSEELVKERPELTKVIFRKYADGEVIAVMPLTFDDVAGYKYICYQHVGQHGSCCHSIIGATYPAKPEDYASLQKELESEPYNYRFQIIKRWPGYAEMDRARREHKEHMKAL